jgi:secretion/DNA translocation related TadE-like protein
MALPERGVTVGDRIDATGNGVTGRPTARGEEGAVTLVAAGVMVLACVLCLVSVDLSRAVLARGRAQTAADAAALAAAQELAIPSGAEPVDEARRFAEGNGATLTSCRCDPGTTEAVVIVRLSVSFVVLGPDRTVTAEAKAVVGLP